MTSERGRKRISHYEILGDVGHGGMGVVHRARDLTLGREVALKRPWSQGGIDPGLKARFLREARTASSLSHPNIIPVYEEFEEEGIPWLVMELVEGESLRSRLDREEPLDVGEILEHAEGLAGALDHAHKRRILHRDITPRNIVIGRDGRARLLDFGLARFFVPPGEESTASTQSTNLTEGGKVVGTAGYMSPEQSLGRPLDARTDIFSFGAVLYEMCTGQHAFTGSDHGAVIDAVLNREPPAIGRRNYDVPPELERIIRKCLAKNPEERYQGARDLLVDLGALRRRREPGKHLPEPVRSRTRWIAAGLSGILLGLLFGATVWYMWPAGAGADVEGRPAWAADLAGRDVRAVAYYERGLHYYDSEEESLVRLDDAIQMFHRALEIEPNFMLARAELGAAYWDRFDLTGDAASREEAAKAVERAFMVESPPPRAYWARGRGHLLEDKYDAARRDLERAVEGEPDNDRAWTSLGYAYQQLGDYAAGLRAFRTAIELVPGRARHRILLGLFHDHFSEFDAAVTAYREALDLKPDSTEALNDLAAAYLHLGRQKEAVEACSRSLKVMETATARANLGTAYYFLDDFERAVENYTRASELEPENAVHWTNLGDAYHELGNPGRQKAAYSEAVELIKKQVTMTPADPLQRMRLGLYCAKSGQMECALREANLAARMQPDSAEILFRVSVIYCLAKLPEKALEWLGKAVKLGLTRAQIEHDPDLPALRDHPRFKRILSLAS